MRPNGLRLSGAAGVRCSRGLGGDATRNEPLDPWPKPDAIANRPTDYAYEVQWRQAAVDLRIQSQLLVTCVDSSLDHDERHNCQKAQHIEPARNEDHQGNDCEGKGP